MEQDFSRQKTQYIFDQNQTQFKGTDFFFPWTIFPPKDLEFFANIFSFTVILLKGRISRQKTFCFKILLALLKARTYYTEFPRKHRSAIRDFFPNQKKHGF